MQNAPVPQKGGAARHLMLCAHGRAVGLSCDRRAWAPTQTSMQRATAQALLSAQAPRLTSPSCVGRLSAQGPWRGWGTRPGSAGICWSWVETAAAAASGTLPP